MRCRYGHIGHVIKDTRQINRYETEHQKETKLYRKYNNLSNNWTRQNQYEDNHWYRNHNKEEEIQNKERKLYDEMKKMTRDLRNEMDRKFSF